METTGQERESSLKESGYLVSRVISKVTMVISCLLVALISVLIILPNKPHDSLRRL